MQHEVLSAKSTHLAVANGAGEFPVAAVQTLQMERQCMDSIASIELPLNGAGDDFSAEDMYMHEGNTNIVSIKR